MPRLLLFPLIAVSAIAQMAEGDIAWLPVTPDETKLSAPIVDKNAGAEALFWRTHVWDEITGDDWRRIYYNYARIKVFTQAGKDKVSTVELVTFRKNNQIRDISARTIKPDGTTIEMKKDAIQDRVLLRAGGVSVQAKTFTLPGVEPGAIIEYRYREIAFRESIRYLRGQFQHHVPIQRSTFFVRPLSRDILPMQMGLRSFNCKTTPLRVETNGFNSLSLENVPAFESETYMPGEPNVRPWILIYYSEDLHRAPEKYWRQVSKDSYSNLRNSLRVNNDIKAAAAEAVNGAATDEQKVLALITYIRKNFRDLFGSAVSESERVKVLKSLPKERRRTSTEVFQSKIATSDELNTLFAAMAQSAGLEARPALVASRDDLQFHPSLAEAYFLNNIDMAVQLDGQWRLFDVSTRDLPANMVSWREEGVKALVSDPKNTIFIEAPLSMPESSQSARRADLKLSSDGTLEGTVRLQYTGHRAAERRQGRTDQPMEKLIESYKETVMSRYPGAEVTEVQIENLEDWSKPVVFSYHLRMPGYAQRTGRRLFFNPLFFQRGGAPLLAESKRRYEVEFPFAWKDEDDILIQLPEGYELDNAEAPGDGDLGEVGSYKVEMGLTKAGALRVRRHFVFGNKGLIVFPVGAYARLKSAFDELHRRDQSMLALRQKSQ